MRVIPKSSGFVVAVTLVALVIQTVLSAPLAEAHQPMHNPGSPDQTAPFLIPAPAVSRAIRGFLRCSKAHGTVRGAHVPTGARRDRRGRKSRALRQSLR